jgi:hypothetical protein
MKGLSRNILLVFSVLVLCVTVVFAEDITITTYYPSPYGSYNELQLYPHSSPATTCDATHKGTMYYDSDDSQIKVCDGSAYNNLGGAGGTTHTICFNGAGCDVNLGAWTGWIDCSAYWPSSVLTAIQQNFNGVSYFIYSVKCSG